ncbi:F-box/kelch-repeat protein At3g23880-like [Silene latifolia]|uniref:F-box/kelch-repeat protein At3g23880-like n=1 Tax=Silene latifolia TaxID=37657 RepID=UPI003D77C312
MESDEDRGNIDRITPELWIEILVRVAPRMVVPLKLVCKTFNTIISYHNFAPLHNKTFGTNEELIRVVWIKRRSTYDDVQYGRSLYSYVNLQQFRTIQLPIASYPYKTQVAGNVNGLLLLHQFKSDDFKWNPCNTLLLWNPLTRQVFHIPNSPLSRITNRSKQVEVAFGYDPVHDDYKIVVFILEPKFQLENPSFLDPKHSAILEIFSLRTKSWRLRVISEMAEIAHFCLGSSVYFNGELHWVVGNELFPVADADVDAAFADAAASGAHHDWASPYYGVGNFTSLMSFNLGTEIFTF